MSATNEENYQKMAQYVQSLGATIDGLQKKIEEQAATIELRSAGRTDTAEGREREQGPKFWRRRDMGKEAKKWVHQARVFAQAVKLAQTPYGAYKITSRFQEDAIGWEINSGKEWGSPKEVIDAVENAFATRWTR